MSLNNYGFCCACLRTDTLLNYSDLLDDYYECPECQKLPKPERAKKIAENADKLPKQGEAFKQLCAALALVLK